MQAGLNFHKANAAISESLRKDDSVWHKGSPSDSPQPKANNPTILREKFKEYYPKITDIELVSLIKKQRSDGNNCISAALNLRTQVIRRMRE